jgi:hypothetical protein
MNDLVRIEEEKSVLLWGGVSGILGSIIFVLSFIFVGVVIGLKPAEPAGWVIQFPDIMGARIIENSLFLAVLILWVFHMLALYYALRGSGHAPRLFGSALAMLGLGVLAAEALQHIAQVPIASLYHAAGVTPDEQTTLVFLWQTTQGILDAMFITGLVLLPPSLILLGMAMLRTPTFGKGFGGMSMALGAAGLIAAGLLVVEPKSVPGAVTGIFVLVGFNLILGWKVFRLSRVS